MVLRIRSQKQRTIDRANRLNQWHRKWAWWPTCVADSDGTSVWVWMRYYYRQFQSRVDYNYRYGKKHYYVDIFSTHYALDDFELLKRTGEQQA